MGRGVGVQTEGWVWGWVGVGVEKRSYQADPGSAGDRVQPNSYN